MLRKERKVYAKNRKVLKKIQKNLGETRRNLCVLLFLNIKQIPMQWLLRVYEDLSDVIALDSIGCQVSLDEIYDRIEFAEGVDD